MTDPKKIKALADVAYWKYLRGETGIEEALAAQNAALIDLIANLIELQLENRNAADDNKPD